jgi:hypothetical protein
MTEDSTAFTLPSGRIATLRRAKGRDLIRAHRVTAGNTEPVSLSFALIAEIAQIDGKELVYEDVLETNLDDVLALENAILGAAESNVNFSRAASSRTSETGFPQQSQSLRSSILDSRSKNS